jgi:hypothetical protein
MKTLKIFTIFALVATFSLATISPAWAHPGHGLPPGHSHVWGGGLRHLEPVPSSSGSSSETHHYYHDDRGAAWGALAGGTILGVVLSNAANQPDQATQPTVVVVQQPNVDATAQQQYLEQEIERERQAAGRFFVLPLTPGAITSCSPPFWYWIP